MDLEVIDRVLDIDLRNCISRGGYIKIRVIGMGLNVYRIYLGCLKRDYDIVCKYIKNVYGLDCGFEWDSRNRRSYRSREISGEEIRVAFGGIGEYSSKIRNIVQVIDKDLDRVFVNDMGFDKISVSGSVDVYKNVDNEYELKICLGGFGKRVDEVWERIVERYNIGEYTCIIDDDGYFKKYRMKYDSIDKLGAIEVMCKLYS